MNARRPQTTARAASGPGAPRWRLASTALVLAALARTGSLPPPEVHASESARAPDPAVVRTLNAYLADPRGNRRALLKLRRQDLDNLPPDASLLLADAYLRAGRPRIATALLRQVVAWNPSDTSRGWAELALGWIALSGGDLADARLHCERVASGTWSTSVGRLMLGLVDAAEGRGPTTIEAVPLSGLSEQALHPVAHLGSAYASYWANDFEAAAAAFTAAAQIYAGSTLADDARYGAAAARLRMGDREDAVAALTGLAGTEPADGRRASGALANLEPRAIFRDGRRRYRKAPLGRPEEMLVALLDMDGRALARVALARLGQEAGGAEPAEVRARSTPSEVPRTLATPPPPASAPTASPPRGGGEPRGWGALIAAVIAAAVVSIVGRRLVGSRSGGTPPRGC